jgi:hypothetical protein
VVERCAGGHLTLPRWFFETVDDPRDFGAVVHLVENILAR